MKALTRIACISLLLPFVSVSYSFAEEAAKDTPPLSAQGAKDLIASMPGAADATSGSVETEVPQDFYDSYGRQLQYRENVKEFRSMLEARQQSFTLPHVTAKSRYRDNLSEVYKAESAVYQKELEKEAGDQTSSTSSGMVENKGLVDVVEDIFDTSDESEGLKEEVVSSEVDVSEGEAMKKVITSDDAPEFDPTDLEAEFGEAVDAVDGQVSDAAEEMVDDTVSEDEEYVVDPMDDVVPDDVAVPLDTVEDEAAVSEDVVTEPAVDLAPEEEVDASVLDEDSLFEGEVDADLEGLLPSVDDLEAEADEVLSEGEELEAVISE